MYIFSVTITRIGPNASQPTMSVQIPFVNAFDANDWLAKQGFTNSVDDGLQNRNLRQFSFDGHVICSSETGFAAVISPLMPPERVAFA